MISLIHYKYFLILIDNNHAGTKQTNGAILPDFSSNMASFKLPLIRLTSLSQQHL